MDEAGIPVAACCNRDFDSKLCHAYLGICFCFADLLHQRLAQKKAS
jgi:hypothetical protein